VGSPAAAALVAQIVFWGLFLVGIGNRELSIRSGGFILLLYLAAMLSGAYRPYWLPFSTCVAILDIALVLIVAKRDLRLS
jgi:hypothetical protein